MSAVAFLGGRLTQLEDHGERRRPAEADFGLVGPQALDFRANSGLINQKTAEFEV